MSKKSKTSVSCISFQLKKLETDRPLVLPMIFVLMKSRTEDYRDVSKALKKHSEELGANFQLTDISDYFELAAVNALRLEFPGTSLPLCRCHYLQSLQRRLVKDFGTFWMVRVSRAPRHFTQSSCIYGK